MIASSGMTMPPNQTTLKPDSDHYACRQARQQAAYDVVVGGKRGGHRSSAKGGGARPAGSSGEAGPARKRVEGYALSTRSICACISCRFVGTALNQKSSLANFSFNFSWAASMSAEMSPISLRAAYSVARSGRPLR